MVLGDGSIVLFSQNTDKNCGSHPDLEAPLNMNLTVASSYSWPGTHP